MIKVGKVDWTDAGKEVLLSIETIIDNRPSADNTMGVDSYFEELTSIGFKAIQILERLEIQVAGLHLEFFRGLDPKSHEWYVCKNSSTNANRYGDVYAGEAAIIKNSLERTIKLLTEERMGMNTLLSKLKNR